MFVFICKDREIINFTPNPFIFYFNSPSPSEGYYIIKKELKKRQDV
jgi:hypothetical protein